MKSLNTHPLRKKASASGSEKVYFPQKTPKNLEFLKSLDTHSLRSKFFGVFWGKYTFSEPDALAFLRRGCVFRDFIDTNFFEIFWEEVTFSELDALAFFHILKANALAWPLSLREVQGHTGPVGSTGSTQGILTAPGSGAGFMH